MPVTTRSQSRKQVMVAEPMEWQPTVEMMDWEPTEVAVEMMDWAMTIPTVETMEWEPTRLEINSQPGPEYFPNYKYHDLANDEDLQWMLYGKHFFYGLENWPQSCWFQPKCFSPRMATFAELFSKLQFKQLFSYAYRQHNPHKMVNVKVDCELEHAFANPFIHQFRCLNMPLGSELTDIVNLERELIKRCTEVLDANCCELNRIIQVTVEQA